MEREADPVRQLRRGAGIIRRLNERVWLLADILRGAHATDERLAPVWAVWHRRHLDANRRTVEALQARGRLRPGLAPDDAVDTLYALTGTDVYRALVRESGLVPCALSAMAVSGWLQGTGGHLRRRIPDCGRLTCTIWNGGADDLVAELETAYWHAPARGPSFSVGRLRAV